MSNPNVAVDDLASYENGDMAFEDVVDMFQRLIDSGMAWVLQGHYGRTALDLISAGYCVG